MPTIARDFHKENIRRIVDEAFEQAQLTEKVTMITYKRCSISSTGTMKNRMGES